MTKQILLAVLIAVAVPSAAQAHTTIVEPEGSHFPYQQWVDEAEVPTPDITLSVIEAPEGCPGVEGAAGCTDREEHIWLSPTFAPREAFFHELGHNVDAHDLPQWMRERFTSLLGLSGAWERPDEHLVGDAPFEQFAWAWAECAVKPYMTWRVPRLRYVFGEDPKDGYLAHNAICRMVAKLSSTPSPSGV